jgi:inosose dehydratase
MSITIITAPCCWGVNDVTNPNLPPWHLVMREAAKAGYCGLELGPHGYMPLDVVLMSEAVGLLGLPIVAGTISDDLVSAGNRNNLLRQADEICSLISRLPEPTKLPGQHFSAPYLTVIDWGHEERDYAAGHSDRAPRLPDALWEAMVDNLGAIAELARDRYGVRTLIHPHAGGYIEYADEIERIVSDVPQDTAGLCLDTGHCYYSGMDPAAALDRFADRLDYVHFRDIDLAIYRRAMSKRIRFFDACGLGVMCPIGRGNIDYPGIRTLLDRIGYDGFISVEQEGDPLEAAGNLTNVIASRDYLKRIGF